jgi:hypothetical protein
MAVQKYATLTWLSASWCRFTNLRACGMPAKNHWSANNHGVIPVEVTAISSSRRVSTWSPFLADLSAIICSNLSSGTGVCCVSNQYAFHIESLILCD